MPGCPCYTYNNYSFVDYKARGTASIYSTGEQDHVLDPRPGSPRHTPVMTADYYIDAGDTFGPKVDSSAGIGVKFSGPMHDQTWEQTCSSSIPVRGEAWTDTLGRVGLQKIITNSTDVRIPIFLIQPALSDGQMYLQSTAIRRISPGGVTE